MYTSSSLQNASAGGGLDPNEARLFGVGGSGSGGLPYVSMPILRQLQLNTSKSIMSSSQTDVGLRRRSDLSRVPVQHMGKRKEKKKSRAELTAQQVREMEQWEADSRIAPAR